MTTITAYQEGDRLTLEPSSSRARSVEVALAEDVEIRLCQMGDRRLYRRGQVYGVSLTTALSLGWCRLHPQ
jgi:hypothetical protein